MRKQVMLSIVLIALFSILVGCFENTKLPPMPKVLSENTQKYPEGKIVALDE